MHWLFHTWPRKALFFHARYLAILGRYLPASQVMVRQILVLMLAHGTLCISGVSRSVPPLVDLEYEHRHALLVE